MKRGGYYILIGDDDETWDIGLLIDAQCFETILVTVADSL